MGLSWYPAMNPLLTSWKYMQLVVYNWNLNSNHYFSLILCQQDRSTLCDTGTFEANNETWYFCKNVYAGSCVYRCIYLSSYCVSSTFYKWCSQFCTLYLKKLVCFQCEVKKWARHKLLCKIPDFTGKSPCIFITCFQSSQCLSRNSTINSILFIGYTCYMLYLQGTVTVYPQQQRWGKLPFRLWFHTFMIHKVWAQTQKLLQQDRFSSSTADSGAEPEAAASTVSLQVC